MELRRASSSTDDRTARPLAGGTEVVPLLRAGLLDADTLVDIRGVVPRGIDGDAIGAGATLAELECDPRGPGRAARGVPARGEPAAPQHGLARRQPAAGDALLVLAAQLAVPPARRRRVLRAARASTASTRSSRTTSARPRIRPTSPPRCSRSTRRCGRAGASCRSPSSTACPTEDDRRTTTLDEGELILEVELPDGRAERLPEGDGAEALGVPDRRRRRRPGRRRDPHRARRRRPDPLAPRGRASTRPRRCRGTRTRSTWPARS